MPDRLIFSMYRFLLLLTGLALPWTALAQTIPAKGSAETLDVATWNIEWFGDPNNGPSNDATQLANVKTVLEQAGIDLWAVQEIQDPNDFTSLLTQLGTAWAGALATEHSGQRIGYLYRTEVFRVRKAPFHILQAFASDFASRPPLQFEVDVVLPDTTVAVTFITLHMKAFDDLDSYNKRVNAASRLKNHIDFGTLNREPVIVLGDLNDELGRSIAAGQPSPYDNFVQDTTHYSFLTKGLDEANVHTFCNNSTCSSGSTLDHLLITEELVPHYEANSVARYTELTTAISSYTSTTSDHLPVFARFAFKGTVATEAPRYPATLRIEAAWPNPFRQQVQVAYTLDRPGPIRLAVVDVLGRTVAVLAEGLAPGGTHEVVWEAAAWPPGLYLLRLTTPTDTQAHPLVHLR